MTAVNEQARIAQMLFPHIEKTAQQLLAENAGESMGATTAPGVVSNTAAYNDKPTFSVLK